MAHMFLSVELQKTGRNMSITYSTIVLESSALDMLSLVCIGTPRIFLLVGGWTMADHDAKWNLFYFKIVL